MSMYFSLSVLMILISALLSFIFNYTNLLCSLLALEMMSVCVYWVLMTSFLINGGEFFFLFFFLLFLVCDSVVGLSLLVVSVYSHNMVYMENYNMLVC